jgi:hypothetical protein
MNGNAEDEGDGSRPRASHTGARVREKKPKSTVKSVINHSSLLEAFTQQSAYGSFRSLNHQAQWKEKEKSLCIGSTSTTSSSPCCRLIKVKARQSEFVYLDRFASGCFSGCQRNNKQTEGTRTNDCLETH